MSQAQSIVDALGGFDNIVEIEPCITRLRCELEDGSLVDEPALKAAGAHGVVKLGDIVQVVVGPNADTTAGPRCPPRSCPRWDRPRPARCRRA